MAGEMRKERTGVIVIRVAIWPLRSSLPREQCSGTQQSYATRQSSSLRMSWLLLPALWVFPE